MHFVSTGSSVNENAGLAAIPVDLSSASSLPVTISYTVTGGTATAGTDYTYNGSTLSFAPGATRAYINLNIVNDAVFESNETFIISLSAPRNASLGTPSATTVTILNDDALPVLQFGASSYVAGENASKLTIPVSLAGATSLPVSINYSVTGGNATAGADYIGSQGRLSFSPGTTTATINITIVNDTAIEGNESIVLTLISPVNVTIGSRGSATITITDDDAPPAPLTYTISLVEGWNLISLPIAPGNASIQAIFPAEALAGIVDIWGWNESQQNWIFYSPDQNDYFYDYYPALTSLEPGKAYWVEMNRSATFTVQGTVPDNAPHSPTALVSEWNFVGLTGLSSSTPAALYPAAVDVWGWDAAEQNWVYYSPDPDDYFYAYYPKLENIQPGHGYWVEMA